MADLSGLRDTLNNIRERVTRLGAAIDNLQAKASAGQEAVDALRDNADEIVAALDELIADAEGTAGDIPADTTPEEPAPDAP